MTDTRKIIFFQNFVTIPRTTITKTVVKNHYASWAVVAHAFNPSIWEAEAGGSQSVPGQPGLLHRETLSQKQNKTTTLNRAHDMTQQVKALAVKPGRLSSLRPMW